MLYLRVYILLSVSSGTLGIRGCIVLYVLISLLVSKTSTEAADSPEAEVSSLKLRLNLMMNRYRLLCNQYSNLASNCSAPGTVLFSSRIQQIIHQLFILQSHIYSGFFCKPSVKFSLVNQAFFYVIHALSHSYKLHTLS